MSIEEKREEAEAVLDSAEMVLETYGGGETARELETKVNQLEKELQDPDSEKALEELIEEIRELMEDVKSEPADEAGMGEPGMGGGEPHGRGGGAGGGAPPEDDMPPF